MFEKLKEKFKKKKDEAHEIPEKWLEKKPVVTKNLKTRTVTVQFQKGRKFHLPGLRQGKRLLATVLMVFNFFIAQTALVSASASQPLALLFYLNCFIALDYVWKTRKKKVMWKAK